MKISVTIARIIVGVLFIFSGLIKAIDPLGLTYKMQEFFEVWARDGYFTPFMNWIYNYAFIFSIIMITFEVVLGVALLSGWKKKAGAPAVVIADVVFYFFNQLCCVQRQNCHLRMFRGLYPHYACCYVYKRCYSFIAHHLFIVWRTVHSPFV